MKKKTIFIIPGFKQRPTHKAYKEIAKVLKSRGHNPILVAIPWKQTTISENIAYFLKEYKKIKTREKYILGFSFGAMIAFIAATKVSTAGLILCSLSPYFKEDVTKSKKILVSALAIQRHEDFSQFHSETLAKKIKAKQILMLYGALEDRVLIRRVTQTYNHIVSTQKYLFPIQQTEHNITDRRYLQTIHQATQSLL